MPLHTRIVIGLLISLAAIFYAVSMIAATQIAPEKAFRHGAIFAAILVGAGAVWFYAFQRHAANGRMTMWSLLWLVAALAVGARIAVSILANAG